MTEDGASGADPKVQGRRRDGGRRAPWRLERLLTVVNTSVLIVGGLLAAIEWLPKMEADRVSYAAHVQMATVPSSALDIVDLGDAGNGSHCYEVTYDVATKNQSERAITITYTISEMYLGDRMPRALGVGDAYVVNNPPNPWNRRHAQGQINWTRVFYDASLIDGAPPKDAGSWLEAHFGKKPADSTPDAVRTFFAQNGYQDLSPAGGMTGIVSPGDTTGETGRFILRARPAQYLGLVVAYGIDTATTSPNPKINLTSDVKQLHDDARQAPDEGKANAYCLGQSAGSPG